jgi:hypothetical protein
LHFEGDALQEPQLEPDPDDLPPPAMTLLKEEKSFSTSVAPHSGQVTDPFPKTSFSNSWPHDLHSNSNIGIDKILRRFPLKNFFSLLYISSGLIQKKAHPRARMGPQGGDI